jgi:hypothetical protein
VSFAIKRNKQAKKYGLKATEVTATCKHILRVLDGEMTAEKTTSDLSQAVLDKDRKWTAEIMSALEDL